MRGQEDGAERQEELAADSAARSSLADELLARFAAPQGKVDGLAAGETVEVTAAGGGPASSVLAVVSRIAPVVDVPSQREAREDQAGRRPSAGPRAAQGGGAIHKGAVLEFIAARPGAAAADLRVAQVERLGLEAEQRLFVEGDLLAALSLLHGFSFRER
jgi:hypothetical protein